MNTSRKESALLALQQAIQIRKALGYRLWDAISVYDCADRLGLEVRFIDIPSLEAIYHKGSPSVILISSLRPAGRQVFNCAHEIGHHIFNHGNRLDEKDTFPNSRLDPEEFLAQTFAGYLLMPKAAVEGAFAKHGIHLQSCTPLEVYTISNWFGVGYETLIDHMRYSLRIIPSVQAEELKKTSPQQIREALVGRNIGPDFLVITPHWLTRPIDIQVGDTVLFSKGVCCDGDNMEFLQSAKAGDLFKGTEPGISQVRDPSTGWAAFVRISKRGFVGRSIFRHLDDPDYAQRESTNNQ